MSIVALMSAMLLLVPHVRAADAPGLAGDIYVTTPTPGAAIFVDGQATGLVTPAMVRNVPAGNHLVKARTECASAESNIVLASGVIARAELTPVGGKGFITVNGTPTGARVLLDGADVCALPCSVKDLACGEHTVLVRAPGFLEQSRVLRVPAFENTILNVDLKREQFGSLVVDITPLEASISLDGLDMGSGPRTIDHIAAGNHQVVGSCTGYQNLAQEVEIEGETITRTSMVLQPAVAATTPKVKKERKEGSVKVGRIVLDSAVSVVGLGLGGYGLMRHFDARDAIERRDSASTRVEAELIDMNQVQPARLEAAILGGTGAAFLIGAGVLWVTTDF